MYLSKSQYIRGLQCHKALWLYRHKRELRSEPDQQTLDMFATGHEVGDLAKTLFPNGTEIEFNADNFQGMIDRTTELMEQGTEVIYEAAFNNNGVFVMTDILVRNGDTWDFYEVKASARVKPYHEDDVAIQWFALSNQISLGKAHIVHINTGYTFSGQLDIQQLFTIEDVTETVKERQAGIDKNLTSIATMLKGKEPDIAIGIQCTNPFDCDFKSYCWQQVPYPSVFNLYNLRSDRKFELFHQGLVSYEDVKSISMTATQELQVKTALNGEPHIDKYRIGEFLKEFIYPINFLDFETFSSAVPRLEGQHPYSSIPFQYSLHIIHKDGLLEHKEYLADENSDPRPGLAEQLVNDVTSTGTIVAFSKGFEQSVIKTLAQESGSNDDTLLAMVDRFIDLLTPFRELMFYHPNFNGTFSLKSVLPAMFPDDDELDYKKLDVQDGMMAMGIYANLHKVENPKEKQAFRESLLAYCKLDTLAMVKIWQRLNDVCR